MKNDEFAFFNQQLAAMARDGIPLETAMHRLCAGMKRGAMRRELELLQADLAKGTPLREAARARKLPELYKQMLEVAAQSQDLPGVLTMLADHYQKRHAVMTRLKGLMVYPAIVLFGTFLLACFLGFLVMRMSNEMDLAGIFYWGDPHRWMAPLVGIWFPPIILGLATAGVFLSLGIPSFRRKLRWKLPAFRESSVAQIASALALMLRSGVTLDNALRLTEQLERNTPAEKELAQWRQRLASGHGKISEMAANSKLFPPLFVWTVSQSREDLASGFQRASEIYLARAAYRTDLLLYSAMPCTVLPLALIVVLEMQPVILMFKLMMDQMSG